MAEEVYEVERIVSHVFEKKRNKTHILYNIKWLNYDDSDNTWEKESNVFATDLIVSYWESLPKDSADRKMFEQIQSQKKNPILLPSNLRTDSSSRPAETKTKTIAELFQSAASIAAEVDSLMSSTQKDKQPEETPVVKRMPVVVVNEDDDDDDEDDEDDEGDEEKEEENNKLKDTPVESVQTTPSVTTDDPALELEESDVDDKRVSNKRPTNASSYSDYFLEQHELKKRRLQQEEEGAQSDSGIDIIFDEKYGVNPPMDWQALAERVDFVGREIQGAPFYCIVLWKDGIKSVHPVDLVKSKRPDLLIDYFIQQIEKN